MKINYLVFGTGALGTVFGGFLQKFGCDVSYYDAYSQDGSHFDIITKNGIKIEGIWGEHNISPIKIFDIESDNSKFDVILLCVKSTATKFAAEQASKFLKEDGLMISIQNGLNNWELISEVVGKNRTIGGRIIFGVERPAPGVVKVSVYADKVLLGNPWQKQEFNSDLLTQIGEDINNSKIPTEIVSSEKINAKLWEKVLYNSVLNPLGALLEVPYGKLGENPETLHIMENILQEIFKVIKAMKIVVYFKDWKGYYALLIDTLLPLTKNHHSSMYQDIKAGRKTEIDALNGAIVKYAKKLNISIPFNEMLVNLIKFKEKKQN